MTSVPRPPAGTGAAGRRLWRSILADFELSATERLLLEQAVRVADTCAELQARVDTDGLLIDGRANPALTELRAQRTLLGRLIVALRVPIDEDEDAPPRTQRRGPRGFYAVRGGGDAA